MSERAFLPEIVAHKRQEVEQQQREIPLSALLAQLDHAPTIRPFAAMLRHGDRLGLIAEIKQRSPAKGLLSHNFDPVHLAQIYAANGADAISILTDQRFFGGSLEHLRAIRRLQDQPGSRSLPLLRKDFLLDDYQVYQSRVAGADAVLLIVAALAPQTVGTLLRLVRELGMEALVEVHTEHELRIALDAGADLIGINNRNLHTFQVDVSVTERIMSALPHRDRPVMVSLSGISSAQEAHRLRVMEADAILVGEAIMTAPDPAAKVRELSGQPASTVV